MSLTFIPVETPEQIDQLADIAHEIWHDYWPALIGEEQTEYMVERFQSADAIKRDMTTHAYRYWLLYDEQDALVGYTGGAMEVLTGEADHDAEITRSKVMNDTWPKRFFISKVYLYARERGKHYASEVLRFYEDLCASEGVPVMYLTVNRDNELGVRAYLGRGFTIVEEVDNAIGDDFVMNDYVMAKEIQLSTSSL